MSLPKRPISSGWRRPVVDASGLVLSASASRRTSMLPLSGPASVMDKLPDRRQRLDPESNNQNRVCPQPLRNGLFHWADGPERSLDFPQEDFYPSGNRRVDLRTRDGRRPVETLQPFPNTATPARCSHHSRKEIRLSALDQGLLRSTKAPSRRNRPRIPPRLDWTKLTQVGHAPNAHRTGQSEEQVVFSRRKNTTLRMSGLFSAAGNIQPKLMRQRELTQERSIATSSCAPSIDRCLFAGSGKLTLLRHSLVDALRTQHRIPQPNVDQKARREIRSLVSRTVTTRRLIPFVPLRTAS